MNGALPWQARREAARGGEGGGGDAAGGGDSPMCGVRGLVSGTVLRVSDTSAAREMFGASSRTNDVGYGGFRLWGLGWQARRQATRGGGCRGGRAAGGGGEGYWKVTYTYI